MPQVLIHRVLLLESIYYVVACMFVFVRRGRSGDGLFKGICGSPVYLLFFSSAVYFLIWLVRSTTGSLISVCCLWGSKQAAIAAEAAVEKKVEFISRDQERRVQLDTYTHCLLVCNDLSTLCPTYHVTPPYITFLSLTTPGGG